MTEFDTELTKLNAEVIRLRRQVKTLHTLALELLADIRTSAEAEGFTTESIPNWERWTQIMIEEM